MKISYNWLKDFVKTDLSIEKVSDILTDIGLEVEGTEQIGISKEDLKNFVVGEVISCEKHPNADKLKITQVNLGKETVQIVCGAPNVDAGQKVPVATPGSVIKDDKGTAFKIKKAKLRGEASNGMICSKKELRISEDHDGIWVMDSNLEPGTPLSRVIDTETDTIIEIGLTPNRADAMSHFGVARDLYVALKARKLQASYHKPEVEDIPSSTADNPITVEVKDIDLCPRYAGLYIKNVAVKESPLWLQKRLKAIGLTPKNNIVDITNYVLHHVGQPMHAFDADTIKGDKIIVAQENRASKFVTLDKEERKLNGEELMILDQENNLAIAGVMGGLDSSVTENTKNIFLESAYFNPVSVRKTSKSHAINSDSSFRFERGIDPNYTVDALKIATHLILEIAGGEVVGDIIDNYPNPIKNVETVLQYRKIDQLLGERLHRNTIKDILKLLEIDIISETPNTLELEIPAYRVDVLREADLIEDILRIYGYNALIGKEKMSYSIVPGIGYEKNKIINTLAESLVSMGFNETMNLSMFKKEYNEWFGFNDDKSVELLNALSTDLAYMRRTLFPSLLNNIDYNIKRKQERIKFFELGHTYQKTAKGFVENEVLAIAVNGYLYPSHWDTPTKKVDIFYLKGVVNHLLEKFKLNDVVWKENQDDYSTYGLMGKIDRKEIVKVGEFSSKILKRFDINEPVYYAEIQLNNFIDSYTKRKQTIYKEVSKFPQVKRDLALLLDKQIAYQSIVETVNNIKNPLIKSVDLFDVYEGDKLPEGKKSYAISLLLQNEDKTMEDSEIDKIMQGVINSLKKELNAELR